MLIRNAELLGHGRADVRIAGGCIAAIGSLAPRSGELLLDARGGALLPGLHDHHIHLAALAAKRSSIFCGPPDIAGEEALAHILARPGAGWLRGIGYHESVAGVLDKASLDRLAPTRPVRIQHRSGRMWFLNSAALAILLTAAAPPPSLDVGTGRLFDADDWLRSALGGTFPDLAATSAELASMGVTGITDMSPRNDPATAEHVVRAQDAGHLLQSCVLAGTSSLADYRGTTKLTVGPFKLHLHEAQLPDYGEAVAAAIAAHASGRVVAIHCVTEAELVFAIGVLTDAGVERRDRIEHASVASDALVDRIAETGIAVVAQPHFIAERGDQYLGTVDAGDIPHLYRLASFRCRGVVLAGGSDAPLGDADPWAAMHAAVSRRTRAGAMIGDGEALTRDEALALFLADPHDLGKRRTIHVGAPADLCLLDKPWCDARLSAGDVRATVVRGDLVYKAP